MASVGLFCFIHKRRKNISTETNTSARPPRTDPRIIPNFLLDEPLWFFADSGMPVVPVTPLDEPLWSSADPGMPVVPVTPLADEDAEDKVVVSRTSILGLR